MKLLKLILLGVVSLLAISMECQNFEDNFSKEQEGDFPSKWELIQGGALIKTIDGNKVLALDHRSIISPKLGSTDYLSENFTITFEALFDKAPAFNGTYYEIRFWPGTNLVARYDNDMGKGSYGMLKIYRHGITMGNTDEVKGSTSYRVVKAELEDKNRVWRTITLNYRRGNLGITIDGIRIIHIPDYKFLPEMISIEGYARDGYTYLVSAMRQFSLIDHSTTSNDGSVSENDSENNTVFGVINSTTEPELIDTKLRNTDPSGLEAIDEGNGIGWRLIGRNPDNYGNIGGLGVDLSLSYVTSSDNGATGNFSFASGRETIATGQFSASMNNKTIASGKSSIATGSNSISSGDISTAMGNKTKASGFSSTSLGNETIASGFSSTAMGFHTTADDQFSTVVGRFNDHSTSSTILFQVGNGSSSGPSNALSVNHDGVILAPSFELNMITDSKALVTKEYVDNNIPGLNAIDESNGIGWRLARRNSNHYGNIGKNAVDFSFSSSGSTTKGALGNSSFAAGTRTEATGTFSFAIGSQTTASGAASTAIGRNSKAQGNASFAAGENTSAIGTGSAAFGTDNVANASNSLVIGKGNITSTPNALVIGQYNNPSGADGMLLQVGVGTSDTNRRDIFWLRNDGAARLNGEILKTSDIRLKTGITPLKYGLNSILRLKPTSYFWKKDLNKNKKSIGLIAQEVQPIINEIVFEEQDKDQTLSINYTALIPVLIKAIQEQQEIIDNQDKRINQLSAELSTKDQTLEKLKLRVDEIETLLKKEKL